MKPQSDKARLVTAAQTLADELRTAHVRNIFRIKRHPARPFQTLTGGWALTIATWVGRPKMELWLDKFLGGSHRHFWFGFISTKEVEINSLISQMPESLSPRKTYSDGEIKRVGGVCVLKRSPSASDISYPIAESYPSEKVYCVGMYDNGSHGSSNPLQLDPLRASTFIASVVRAVTDLEEEYPSIKIKEGRRIVEQHIRLERDWRAALRCKERDDFKCQVCTLCFKDWYGEEFAEAHHKVPLSKMKCPRVAKADDLITVCANCHRMLHRMDGEADNVEKLREILKTHHHPLLSNS
jgi:5-methylcytosine-specific restriction endonuclease McrA